MRCIFLLDDAVLGGLSYPQELWNEMCLPGLQALTGFFFSLFFTCGWGIYKVSFSKEMPGFSGEAKNKSNVIIIIGKSVIIEVFTIICA